MSARLLSPLRLVVPAPARPGRWLPGQRADPSTPTPIPPAFRPSLATRELENTQPSDSARLSAPVMVLPTQTIIPAAERPGEIKER